MLKSINNLLKYKEPKITVETGDFHERVICLSCNWFHEKRSKQLYVCPACGDRTSFRVLRIKTTKTKTGPLSSSEKRECEISRIAHPGASAKGVLYSRENRINHEGQDG